MDEDRPKPGVIPCATASPTFPTNASVTPFRPRRRVLWGLKHPRSLVKHSSSGTTEGWVGPSKQAGGYRWGTRLRKLNTKLMGTQTTKRLWARQRVSHPGPATEVTIIDVRKTPQIPEVSSSQRLPKPDPSLRGSGPHSQQFFTSRHNDDRNRDDEGAESTQEGSCATPPDPGEKSSPVFGVTTNLDSLLHQYRRGNVSSLARHFRCDSLLNQLEDQVSITSSDSLPVESSKSSFQSSVAHKLFLGGLESGIPPMMDPSSMLRADIGNS